MSIWQTYKSLFMTLGLCEDRHRKYKPKIKANHFVCYHTPDVCGNSCVQGECDIQITARRHEPQLDTTALTQIIPADLSGGSASAHRWTDSAHSFPKGWEVHFSRKSLSGFPHPNVKKKKNACQGCGCVFFHSKASKAAGTAPQPSGAPTAVRKLTHFRDQKDLD